MPSELLPAGLIAKETIAKLPGVAQRDAYLLYGEHPPTVANPAYKKQEPVSKTQIESINRGDILYEDDETVIISPENPLVPNSEGTHIRLISKNVPAHPKTSQEWHAWLRHTHKVFGAAKVVTEGAVTEDIWPNLLWGNEFAADGYLTTDILGRKLGKSFGATAPMPQVDYDHRDMRLPQVQRQQLARTMQRYFRQYWLSEMKNVELFAEGLHPVSPDSPQFQAKNKRDPTKPFYYQNELMVSSGIHEEVAVIAAHVPSGIHLMMNIVKKPVTKRPWQDLTPAFESMVLAEASAQTLMETQFEGKPVAAKAYVRATGSWLARFATLPEDEFVKIFGIDKAMKRRFLGKETTRGLKEGLETNFHPHVLGIEFPDEALDHHAHAIDKGEADWEGSRHMSKEKMDSIRTALNKTIADRIIPSQGKIV